MSDGRNGSARRFGRRAGDTLFLAALGFSVGVVTLFGARTIAPPIFDPVGSAVIPVTSATVLMLLSVLIVIGRFRTKSVTDIPPSAFADSRRLAAVFALMVVYLGAMELGAGFVGPTAGFIAAAVLMLVWNWKAIVPAAVLAIAVSFGAKWLLTSFFYVDLPR